MNQTLNACTVTDKMKTYVETTVLDPSKLLRPINYEDMLTI